MDKSDLMPVSPLEYMEEHTENQVATPSYSSWGNKGYAEVWLNGSNHWIYRHVHKAIERMQQLAQMFSATNGVRRRALNQAARELLLMQSSDWAFIMKTGTTVPYAVRRVREHIHNFNKIYDSLLTNHLDLGWLTQLEEKNNLFPQIDYAIFQ
jgi:1,4-alpha-glucan branching enzyme